MYIMHLQYVPPRLRTSPRCLWTTTVPQNRYVVVEASVTLIATQYLRPLELHLHITCCLSLPLLLYYCVILIFYLLLWVPSKSKSVQREKGMNHEQSWSATRAETMTTASASSFVLSTFCYECDVSHTKSFVMS